MSGMPPTPMNLRSAMARYRIKRADIQAIINMNQNLMTMYLTGVRPIKPWAAHNIGLAINRLTGKPLFRVNDELGVVAPQRTRQVLR